MVSRKYILSLLIIVSFLFIVNPSYGQQQFYKLIDARPYDGNYLSYVVKLYPDSTIEIRVYFIRGGFYNYSFNKTTYKGKYSQKNDTSTILFLKSYFETREKNVESGIKKSMKATDVNFLKTNPTFCIQNGIITSPTLLFPPLSKGSQIEIDSLELAFQKWGNQGIKNNPFVKQY